MFKFLLLTILFMHSFIALLADSGITIPVNQEVAVESLFFSNASPTVNQDTKVTLKYLNDGLEFNFKCFYNKLGINHFINPNRIRPDVLSIFITNDKSNKRYEFRITPRKEIFSTVESLKPEKECQLNKKNINSKVFGVELKVFDDKVISWSGWIFIPFTLIGKSNIYKLNCIRIVKLKSS